MSTGPLPVDSPTSPREHSRPEERWLDVVERQVNALKFGSVHITIHEGRVVQVETSVRVRFDKP